MNPIAEEILSYPLYKLARWALAAGVFVGAKTAVGSGLCAGLCCGVKVLVFVLLGAYVYSKAGREALRRMRVAERQRRGPPRLENFTVDTVGDEVVRLRKTFESGKTRNPKWRKKQLLALHDMLVEHEKDIFAAMKADIGKNPCESALTEMMQTRGEIMHYADHVCDLAKPKRVGTPLQLQPARSFVMHEPRGVVCVIGTWNYPLSLSMIPLAGAIAGGNCTLLKFARFSGHLGPLMAGLLPKYLDMDALSIECGGGRDVIGAILEQELDFIFFTGSSSVGRVIAEKAAKTLTPVLLELGGKNPCIVDKTANIKEAGKRIAWGKLVNCGQTCIAPDYVICVDGKDGKKGKLAELLAAEIKKNLKRYYGETPEAVRASESLGRLSNKGAAERLARHIDKYKAEAKIVHGGDYNVEERFVAPTIVLDPSVDDPIMNEEIFGPILPIVSVETLEDALRLGNKHGCPLASYVYSTNQSTINRVLTSIRSGGACVNQCLFHFVNDNLPFGGRGGSGIGHYHGKATFEAFTHQKGVLQTPSFVSDELVFPPYTVLHKIIFRLVTTFLQ